VALESLKSKVALCLSRVGVILQTDLPKLTDSSEPKDLASLVIISRSQEDTVSRQYDYVLLMLHKLSGAYKELSKDLKHKVTLAAATIIDKSRTEAQVLALEQYKEDDQKVSVLGQLVDDLKLGEKRLVHRLSMLKSLSYNVNALIGLGKVQRALSPSPHEFTPNERPQL